MAKRIYLDWNASSPLSQNAFKAMKNSLANFANASSLHFEGRKARITIEKARDKIAEILGLKSRFNIIFTSGATESAAMVLHSKKLNCFYNFLVRPLGGGICLKNPYFLTKKMKFF